MYSDHARLSVCLSVRGRMLTLLREHATHCDFYFFALYKHTYLLAYYCTDPDVTWGSGRGCPVVVHY